MYILDYASESSTRCFFATLALTILCCFGIGGRGASRLSGCYELLGNAGG